MADPANTPAPERPALRALKLLGKWNWYLPSWLEWLPKINLEGAPEPVDPSTPGNSGPGNNQAGRKPDPLPAGQGA